MKKLNKKGDMPGWAQIVALAIALVFLIFLIWLAIRSGRTGVDIIGEIP